MIFNQTSLHAAVKKGNTDIVKLLLQQKDIDINSINIYNQIIFNTISIQIFIQFQNQMI